MSSLWTPGGEHEVPREPAEPSPADAAQGGVADGFDPSDIDPEQMAEMEARMREAQQQLLSVPAAQVVANHAIGLYELAALHLQVDPPNLDDARIAVDAMGLLVDNLGSALPSADTLAAALQQIRMAFVEVSNAADAE